MVKRRNDGAQESKDDYEARQAREESYDEQETGFSRASADVMKTRRIISLGNKWKKRANKPGSSGGNMVIPPPRSISTVTETTPSTANPFASTTLTPSTGIDTGLGSTSAKSNPFANVTFTTTTTPAVSTQTASSVTSVANNTSKSTASTIPPFISPLAVTKKSLPILREKAMDNENIPMSKKALYSLAMLRMVQMECQHNSVSDWSHWLQIYTDKMKELINNESDEAQDEKKETSNSSSINATGGTIGSTANGGFSFGSTSFSSSTGGGFSFGQATTTPPTKEENGTDAKPTTTFTGFSFKPEPSIGNNTFPSTTPTTTKAPMAASNESSKNGEPSDDMNNNDKSDPLEKTLNKDEISLFECRAKYQKQIESTKEWISYNVGSLRLTKNTVTNKCQLVIRDEIVGKVQFNIAVVKGMCVREPQLNKKKIAKILLKAVQDEAKGFEMFCLSAKEDDADDLYKNLKSITG